MIPQDTDPLRAQGTDPQPVIEAARAVAATWSPSYESIRRLADRLNAYDGVYSEDVMEAWEVPDPDPLYVPEPRPYPGWSAPRPWYRRLAAWVRRG